MLQRLLTASVASTPPTLRGRFAPATRSLLGLIPQRGLSTDATDGTQWNDFNNVTKELRRIAEHEGLRGSFPDTKLLKELGHRELVLAIRKKHGGFVAVATKMGMRVDTEDVSIQKKITSRANRRRKAPGPLEQARLSLWTMNDDQ